MSRRRGKDSRRPKTEASPGTQLEQAPDVTATSRRPRPKPSKRVMRRQSKTAAKTPYGDVRDRRKTS